VLYNTWRPAVFSDISGQPHITKTLLAQLKAGRLAHAYLFTGSRGTGKTTCAKILARAINCRQAAKANGDGGRGTWDGEPCNKCASCLGIINNSVPDVAEIDAASNSGVDNIRALREELVYSPVSSNKRVYIIDEVHMLSAGAFNALLKTLEEPPEHVLFILATTETHKVPATIVSRCQRFAFRRINKEDIANRLSHICEKEEISIDEGGIELLAQMADGSLRDALSLLDQCAESNAGNLTETSVRETLGLSGLGELAAWLREMDDLQKSMKRFDAFYQAGMDVSAILGQLSSLLRDVLMGQMLGDLSVTRLPAQDAEELSALWPRERLLHALEQFAETRLSRSGSKKLEAELCLIRLANPAPTEITAVKQKPPEKPVKTQAEKPIIQSETPPEPPEPPEKQEKPPPEPAADMMDAARDPRWAELMNAIGNPLLKDALSKSGAKVEGDCLVLQNKDPFIQGVLQKAEKEILALFPGGIQKSRQKNDALDALIASAGNLIKKEE